MKPRRRLRHLGGISREYSYAMQECLERASAGSPEVQRREVLVCVTLAVSLVETFWNAFAQYLILQAEYRHASEQIGNDLRKRRGLEQKLEKWPALLFGARFDPSSEPMQRFAKVRIRRNALMHFTSPPGALTIAGQSILMTETNIYDNLTLHDGVEAANAAYAVIAHLLALAVSDDRQIEVEMHYWTGTISAREPREASHPPPAADRTR